MNILFSLLYQVFHEGSILSFAATTPKPSGRENVSNKFMICQHKPPGLAEEMLNLKLAEIGVKANTRVLAVEHELDKDTLDILA